MESEVHTPCPILTTCSFNVSSILTRFYSFLEYESKSTRAFFVTTGYLVRLLANAPEAFTKVTYLIIDEVHERSVDTDILCLLCRRLLSSNDQIRLVLMSATLAAALYQEYFDVSLPVIKVGARRFPVAEVYLSDLSKTFHLGNKAKHIKNLTEGCLRMRCNQAPSMPYMESLFAVAAYLATTVGKPGSSVLIFVTGMNDIVAIMDIVEGTVIPGITFTCIPIHSDIPFDDQMTAFDEARPDEVKVIIATNAAESSVTLPDVDSVICLGLCKQIEYNPTSHRQMLTPVWISKASATQRAGRTGRLRPGTVYRLYEREVFTTYMEEFEQGEMVRVPLDNVILQLKQMIVDERVTDVLASCLEPPNLRTIDRSFESLFQSNFITSPQDDDSCHITQLGHFVSVLGVDLALGSLIGLGIQFGIGAEAIQLAGILSFPKSPWVQSNPLYHDAREFNTMTSTTFTSRCYFDNNLFSEPMAVMNLLWEYDKIPLGNDFKWSRKHGIHLPRLKRLSGTCINLKRRVSDFLKIPNEFIEVISPPRSMPHGKITILRILQVWVFHETIIQFDPTLLPFDKTPRNELVIPLWQNSARIEKTNLDQIFNDPKRHPFSLIGQSCVETKGSLPLLADDQQERFDILENIQERLVSYSTEKEVEVVFVTFKDLVVLYVPTSDTEKLLRDFPILSEGCVDMITFSAKVSRKKSRGRGERPCGSRTLTMHHENRASAVNDDMKLWNRMMVSQRYKKICQGCAAYVEVTMSLKIHLNFSIEAVVDPLKIKILKFSLMVEGLPNGISEQDLKDLFASTSIHSTKNIQQKPQKLVFPMIVDKVARLGDDVNSVNQPLLQCIPEGARLLSVLASSRRGKDNTAIHLSLNEKKNDDDNDIKQDSNDKEELVIFLPPKQMNIMKRWKRFGIPNSQVYVDANSVVGTVVPMFGTAVLYCTCSDTLEVIGGGLRANGGLTLLPPGKLFLQLCRFTFGQYKQENVDDGSYIEKAILLVDPDCSKAARKALKKRIKKAVEFNQSSMALGEQLQCFPEKVKMLLDIFNGVDGYENPNTFWEDLDVNVFANGSLAKLRLAMQERQTKLELEQRMGRLMME